MLAYVGAAWVGGNGFIATFVAAWRLEICTAICVGRCINSLKLKANYSCS